jgi:hypothetical protein
MKLTLALLCWLAISHTTTLAQADKEVIKDDDMKISFVVPDGWQATKRDNGYILGSTDTKGFMLVEVRHFESIKKLKKAMEAGIEQEDGSKLMPNGDLSMLGQQGVSGMYEGIIDDIEMTGFLMALMPPSKSKTVICISIAPKTIFNQSNMDQLKLLLRSVIFD